MNACTSSHEILVDGGKHWSFTMREGMQLRLIGLKGNRATVSLTRFVKALNSEGDLIAIGEARLPHLYHPVLVL